MLLIARSQRIGLNFTLVKEIGQLARTHGLLLRFLTACRNRRGADSLEHTRVNWKRVSETKAFRLTEHRTNCTTHMTSY